MLDRERLLNEIISSENITYIERDKDGLVVSTNNEGIIPIYDEIKNSDIPIMDSNSFGSTYTKLKVVNVKPKYEFEKIGKTKEIDLPKEESKEETQISFEDFTNSFKI